MLLELESECLPSRWGAQKDSARDVLQLVRRVSTKFNTQISRYVDERKGLQHLPASEIRMVGVTNDLSDCIRDLQTRHGRDLEGPSNCTFPRCDPPNSLPPRQSCRRWIEVQASEGLLVEATSKHLSNSLKKYRRSYVQAIILPIPREREPIVGVQLSKVFDAEK